MAPRGATARSVDEEDMTILSFLSPFLLWGAALAVIPIIIHLLYRRRFRRVEWAPMKFLKLTIQHNRRRIRLEQLLLMMMRVAAILLLFFLVSRPVMHAAGLGAWLGATGRANHILVLDDSLSMGYRSGARSAFERAKELAVEVVDTVGPLGRFTVVTASRPSAPLVREVDVSDPEEVVGLLRDQPLSDAYASWGSVLQSVDDLITKGTYPISDVTLVTDLRQAGWDEKVTAITNDWAGRQVRLRIFDVGSEATDNVALTGLTSRSRAALTGVPSRWEAVIRNGMSAQWQGAEATFFVDDNPTAVSLPAVEPGQTVRIPLSATFQVAGPHSVSLQLPEDALPGDDRRWAANDVRDHLRMVLVDGEPSSEPYGGEIDFLALALSVGVAEADAWKIEILTDAEWASRSLGDPDLVVLANVAAPTPENARELTRLTRAGAGVMIFVGDQVDPDIYDDLLYDQGRGILPAQLESVIEEDVSGLLVEDLAASPLNLLGQLDPAVLQRIKIGKYMSVRLEQSQESSARVVARWNNPAASPAVVERTFGRGRCLLWTIAADRAWSDWPASEHSYVLAMRESAMGVARADDVPGAVAGRPLRYPLAPGVQASDPTIETPEIDGAQAMRTERGAPEPAAPDSDRGDSTDPFDSLTYDRTERAGLYRLSWNELRGGPKRARVAVNPNPAESDLTRIDATPLRQLFGNLQVEVIAAGTGDGSTVAVRGDEIWRSLAIGLLGLLMAESCLATWCGRQR